MNNDSAEMCGQEPASVEIGPGERWEGDDGGEQVAIVQGTEPGAGREGASGEKMDQELLAGVEGQDSPSLSPGLRRGESAERHQTPAQGRRSPQKQTQRLQDESLHSPSQATELRLFERGTGGPHPLQQPRQAEALSASHIGVRTNSKNPNRRWEAQNQSAAPSRFQILRTMHNSSKSGRSHNRSPKFGLAQALNQPVLESLSRYERQYHDSSPNRGQRTHISQIDSFADPNRNQFFQTNTAEGVAQASNAQAQVEQGRQRPNIEQLYKSRLDTKGSTKLSKDRKRHVQHQAVGQPPQQPGTADSVLKPATRLAKIYASHGDKSHPNALLPRQPRTAGATTGANEVQPRKGSRMPALATATRSMEMRTESSEQNSPVKHGQSHKKNRQLRNISQPSEPMVLAVSSSQAQHGPPLVTSGPPGFGLGDVAHFEPQTPQLYPGAAFEGNYRSAGMATGPQKSSTKSPSFKMADSRTGSSSNQTTKTVEGTLTQIAVSSFYQAPPVASPHVLATQPSGLGSFVNQELCQTNQTIGAGEENQSFDLPASQKSPMVLAESGLRNISQMAKEERLMTRTTVGQQTPQAGRTTDGFPSHTEPSGFGEAGDEAMPDASGQGEALEFIVNTTIGAPPRGARSYATSHQNFRRAKADGQRLAAYHHANTSPEFSPGFKTKVAASTSHSGQMNAAPAFKIERINEVKRPGRNMQPIVAIGRANNSTTGQGRVIATAGASAGCLNAAKKDRALALGSPLPHQKFLQEPNTQAGRRYNNTVQDHIPVAHTSTFEQQHSIGRSEQLRRMQFPCSTPPTMTTVPRHQKQTPLTQLLSFSNMANAHASHSKGNSVSHHRANYSLYPSAGGGPMDLGKRGQYGLLMSPQTAQKASKFSVTKQSGAGSSTLAQFRPPQKPERLALIGGRDQQPSSPSKVTGGFHSVAQQRKEPPRMPQSPTRTWDNSRQKASTTGPVDTAPSIHYRDDSFGPSRVSPPAELQKRVVAGLSNLQGSNVQAQPAAANVWDASAFFGQSPEKKFAGSPERQPGEDPRALSPTLAAFPRASLGETRIERPLREASPGFKNQQEPRSSSKKKQKALKDDSGKRQPQGLRIIPVKSGHEEGTFAGLVQRLERGPDDEEHSRGQDGASKAATVSGDNLKKGADSSKGKKHIVYKNPKVKIGSGKLGPVDLIIYKDELYALKRVPKQQIDKPKRIEHLKNEKFILLMLRRLHDDFKSGKYNKYAANDHSGLKQLLYDDFNGSRDNNSASLQQNNESTWTSYRNSYQIDEMQIFNDSSPISEHPLPLNYIVRLEETFSDAENLNFILEFLPGRSLHWVIQNQRHMQLGKEDKSKWVKFYASQVLCALETLQRYNIIYRDIKPENMMIDGEGLIKVVDFGFAKILHPQNQFRTSTNCGTVGYTAPELLVGIHSGYSFLVDVWSFGILICELFQGQLPYERQDDPMEIQQQCVQGEIKLPRDIDQATCDLLRSILVVDPNQRITVKEIMKKAFFREVNWERIRAREISAADGDYIPYKPNPNAYRYLLQNQYEEISNLGKPSGDPLSPHSPLPTFEKNGNQLTNAADALKEPHSAASPKKSLLGDFTVRKVNREFENF